MPKVSVIVPVYNVERYLAKCLGSLVHQTLEQIEVLVVDDGSTDGSAKIIGEFSARFPSKIKAFRKENGGLSDARNFGIDHATGHYLAFVDSDDYVEPTMMADMYALAETHGAEIVICNLQKVDEGGRVTQQLQQLPQLPEKIALKDHLDVFSDISYFACNKLFRRDLFNGLRFKKGANFEDIQLVPQLMLLCKTVAKTDSYLYNYLERANSISRTHTARGLDILAAVRDVRTAFLVSPFSGRQDVWRAFAILEGVYSYLAYLAYVEDEVLWRRMGSELDVFLKENGIRRKDIILYRRFGKNYLLSLPLKKKIYYLLYFSGGRGLIRKIL